MFEFSIGNETGSYEAGLITLPDGRHCGIEDVAALTVTTAKPAMDFLDSLRGTLPASARLALPLRLAVSTIRAGLGAIGDELSAGGDRVTVELVLGAGNAIVARMAPELAATMTRDRAVVLGAMARAAPEAVARAAIPGGAEPEGTAQALTSIFRYEKRNGRLRRVGGPDKAD